MSPETFPIPEETNQTETELHLEESEAPVEQQDDESESHIIRGEN